MSTTVQAMKNKDSFEFFEAVLTKFKNPNFDLRFRFLLMCSFWSVPQIYLKTINVSCLEQNKI